MNLERKKQYDKKWRKEHPNYSTEDSYAEEGMLPPSDIGCPRLRMSGIKKDLYISF